MNPVISDRLDIIDYVTRHKGTFTLGWVILKITFFCDHDEIFNSNLHRLFSMAFIWFIYTNLNCNFSKKCNLTHPTKHNHWGALSCNHDIIYQMFKYKCQYMQNYMNNIHIIMIRVKLLCSCDWNFIALSFRKLFIVSLLYGMYLLPFWLRKTWHF